MIVTHGSIAVMVRWLTENGLDAQGFATEYGHDDDVSDRKDGNEAADASPVAEAAALDTHSATPSAPDQAVER